MHTNQRKVSVEFRLPKNSEPICARARGSVSMAIGQTRTISEGLASIRSKISQNPFQFWLTVFMVMLVGATKKVRCVVDLRV